jgi:hypothetical protein
MDTVKSFGQIEVDRLKLNSALYLLLLRLVEVDMKVSLVL